MPRGKTVLIADDDPLLAQALAFRCKELGLTVRTAYTGIATLTAALSDPPDLLIVDVNMPGADGLTVCEQLAADPRLRQMPIIVLTGRRDEGVVRQCDALGASYVLKGAQAWESIRQLLPRLLPGEETPQAVEASGAGHEALATPENASSHPEPVPRRRPKVLLIDDDRDFVRALSIRLGRYDLDIVPAADGRGGFMRAVQEKPDVIITDYSMPDGSGEYLLSQLKVEPATRAIPVIVITGWADGPQSLGHQRDMLGRCGAVAYVRKPPDFGKLLAELSKLVTLTPIDAAAGPFSGA